jgi:GAF domain-containing protein
VSHVNDSGLRHLSNEIEALRRENEALLRELENAYAQLTAVLQVSQDETRIAYSELQEKLVVQEKKLVELAFLSNASERLLEEHEVEPLRKLVVESICLLVPIDLVLLQLYCEPHIGTQRERDLVRELQFDRTRRETLSNLARTLDSERRAAWLVPDLDADSRGELMRLRPDAHSAACLGLRAGGNDIGLLVLNSRLRANFRDDQQSLLESFAHQAAAALDGALRLEWHRNLIARVMTALQVAPQDVERWVRKTAPGSTPTLEIREALSHLVAEDDWIGLPRPRTEPEENR